jgi:DNA-binding CsgD family transcriptional regulator
VDRDVPTLHSWRHNPAMARELREQRSPDLFSTDAIRDASALPPTPSTTEATAEPDPQRHVLPKNLHAAVKHLSDGDLDLLHAATLEELKRRGRLPPGVEADSAQSSAPLSPQNKQFPPTGKISQRRRLEFVEASLTRGQLNAVRSAFKAGITPARIARQFGISQSNVRKALASNESKR